MKESEQTTEQTQPSSKVRPGKLSAGGGLVGVLLILYALLQPVLSKQLGIDLPKLPINATSETVDRDRSVETVDSKSKHIESKAADESARIQIPKIEVAAKQDKPKQDRSDSNDQQPDKPKTNTSSERKRESTSSTSTRPAERKSSDTKSPDADLYLGILRAIGRDSYMSPAGLRYTPGSEEGHRLKHLQRHTEDQPGRPGKHGVFDGGIEKALTVIDQAYEKGKKGGHGTTKSEDRGRTIYTVDLGKRIGYIGGREGNRLRKPMARRVRLVLEGDRVITAYPL
ncbi:MAG: hypothetical protein R3C05_21820 [Pirellulaceae bacterium]